MGFMNFWDQYGASIIEGIVAVLVTAGVIVGSRNGPRAEKARTIMDWIVGILRRVSPVKYKDEPGTLNLPGKGDTGERVKDVGPA